MRIGTKERIEAGGTLIEDAFARWSTIAGMTKVQTYDCTLRDGEQAEGITLSLEDKLHIARVLDGFGIDVIEGGFPASNPKDMQFFKRLQAEPLRHAKLAAFGVTCRKGIPACEDESLAKLLQSGAQVAAIVGKTWDEQVRRALETSPDENLRMIRETIAYLRPQVEQVVFNAEHFFDGYKANADYALACLRAAAEAGADVLALCDTNGGSLPFEIETIVADVVAHFPNVCVGIHCHNDTGCAVASTLAAVRAGARQVQGTINGYGERVGNADLTTIIADLQLKMGYECVRPENLRQLTYVAKAVAEACNLSLWSHSPYVGSSAFAHKGGLHASAIARFPEAYEHIEPERVGNRSRLVVSELAGKASLLSKASALGYELDGDPDLLQRVLDEVKQREALGYSYEMADGSLALLIERKLNHMQPHFILESFRVIVDDREDTGALAKDAQSEATIKVRVGDTRFVATGEGVGPVGALDNALHLALAESYPQVNEMRLIDFKVRLLDESTGTDAITRVVITTRRGEDTWGSTAVSENIIEASWNALVDAVEYGLLRAGV